VNFNDEFEALCKLTESALAGTATTVATRHDCTADKMARTAVEIAKSAMKELKKNG